MASMLGAFNLAPVTTECPVSYDVIGPVDWSYTFNYWVDHAWTPDVAPLPGDASDGFCFGKMWKVVGAYVDDEAAAAGWTVGYWDSTTVVCAAPPPELGDDYWGPWSGFHVLSEPDAEDGR